MPQTRTQKPVLGNTVFLAVAKPGQTGTPTFTAFGCMSKFDETLSKDTLDVSCRSFVGKISAGKEAQSAISIDGFYFIYASGEVATNVSYNELRSWINGPALSFKWGSPFTGDPVYARDYIIKDLKLTGDNDGVATYSMSLESSGAEVASTSL